jgi:putative transposase
VLAAVGGWSPKGRNPPPLKVALPEYRRAGIKGGTFFFTVVTHDRFPLFQQESTVNLLRACFRQSMAIHPFSINAWVILPNHLHIIWTLPENDSDFSVRWKKIKASFSRQYRGPVPDNVSQSMLKKGEKGFWQRRFWEHTILDEADYENHCDYIHFNPVKHGLAATPSDWKYSSFSEFVKKGVYGVEWGESEPDRIARLDSE